MQQAYSVIPAQAGIQFFHVFRQNNPMNYQELIALLLMAASLAYVARNMWQRLTGRRCCSKTDHDGNASPSLVEIQPQAPKDPPQ